MKFKQLLPTALSIFLAWATLPTSAQSPTEENKNRVIMLGMIHSGHETSERYSLDYLRRVIEEIDPDYVVTEIPPDRLADAAAGFAVTGKVTEERVVRFSEYREVLFPLTKRMDFKIIPAAGWTSEMARNRREALDAISKDPARANDWQVYQTAQRTMDTAMGTRRDDPFFIHTDEYDAITKTGLHPYATLFADDLGRGDWERINKSHYTLIEAALDDHQYEDATILIMFGAGHKYWILEQLRKRDDILLTDPVPFLHAATNENTDK